jgi:uncharacterized protein YqjF (DUF2071 family)
VDLETERTHSIPNSHEINAILGQVDHRPWPLPQAPWVMVQVWYDLLFAHWSLPAEDLRRVIPPSLPLDTFDGQAWIGIVPFGISDLRSHGLPAIPWLSAFPELNVRTYVTIDGKPGVYFFSLNVTNPLAVIAARLFYKLAYFRAQMKLERDNNWIDYYCRNMLHGEFQAQYRPISEPTHAALGSLEHWLTERYCLYTTDGKQNVYRADIHHVPWPLQAAEFRGKVNTMAVPHSITLPNSPPLLHFSRRQVAIIWLLERIS